MLVALVAGLLLCCPAPGDGPAAAAAVEMKHHAGPMEKVLAEAKASNRPVMIDFSTSWCGWCRKMEKEVFTDPAVASFSNENLVFYSVDAEKGEGKTLAEKYAVHGFPTFVVVGADGEELDRIAGYRPAAGFLEALKDVRAGNTLAGLKARLEKDPKDAEAHALYGRKLLERENAEEARGHFDKAVELDPKNALPATIEARYWIALLASTPREPGPLQAFADKFPDSRHAIEAHRFLAPNYAGTGETDAALRSYGFLEKKGALDAVLRNDYAWALATNGLQLEKALALVDAALKEKPEEAAFLDTKAECLSRLGRHDEAVTWQKKAVEKADEEERGAYRERLVEFEKKRDAAKKGAEGATGEPKEGAK